MLRKIYTKEDDYLEVEDSNIEWKEFKNSTILITGANGMIASAIIEFLLYLNKKNLNINIVGLVRNLEKAKEKFSETSHEKLVLIEHDIRKPFKKYSCKVNYVIHAASLASPKYYGEYPCEIIEANSVGTSNMLKFANENKAIFLFVSSGEVYGIPEKNAPLTEKDFGYLDPMKLRSCYAESKRIGEAMCVAWGNQHGLDVRVVRPFHTFGPGMQKNDGRIFSDLIESIESKSAIELNSDGLAKRSYCYITDALKGIFLIINKGKSLEAYNLGNPENTITVRELSTKLTSFFKLPKLIINVSKTSEAGYLKSPVKEIVPNIEKLKELGWKPEVSIIEAFYRTLKLRESK